MPRRSNKNKNKKKKNSGLGRAIRNKYGGKPDRENQATGRVKRKNHVIDHFASNPMKNNENKLKSITEVNNLQEFMDTMNAKREIEDERKKNEQIRIISNDPQESTEAQEIKYHAQLKDAELFNYENLPIPRKPKWDKNTTVEQLRFNEKEVFLNWRRSLAHTVEQTHLEMTPFEKNIEVWKQLWNVVERAHLLILIVDARNPLAFVSRDLFKYVKEVDERKRCILLINKADYLNGLQRRYWREYFQSQHIQILYFSAMREEIRFDLLSKAHRDKITTEQQHKIIENIDDIDAVLTVDGLMEIFINLKHEMKLEKVIEVGFIGYPNVGKSSIINVLMREKRVSTGSTPGKTKHFQTLILNDDITLCDCPGLVFPTLMSSKQDMILNGVIPIDHLTEFISPMRLVIHRVNIKHINDVYNLGLPIRNKKRAKFITVYDVLDAFCHQRKMYNKSKVPKRNEASRIMLKDFVKGKIAYNQHPPNLNARNKYLFYCGKILDMNVDNKQKNNTKAHKIENVLDQKRLHGIIEDDDEDDEEEEEEEESDGIDIEDEEFLKVWKHPLDAYGGTLGTSKKKHDKKARVMRRIGKRNQKHGRQFRRDSDNFERGSNAVVVSAVPHIKTKHTPILL